MKWALLSVWDKTGIADLAQTLVENGYRIISSGGTGKTLKEAGIDFVEVSEYTGSPEIMDGRVKTLHPRIHGGLLGRPEIDGAVMKDLSINPIEIVVVNLYPFEQMAGEDLDLDRLIEFIDIGGPAMIRASAKNFKYVAVVVDPADYPKVAEAAAHGGFTYEQRLALARKVFARTAAYDAAIANYLYSLEGEFPETYSFQFRNGRSLRYGENPHQRAAVYGETGIAGQVPLQGKEMSYNNYLDVDAAVSLLREFEEPASVIVKHNNPCGVALGEDVLEAYIAAREVDPVSAYGSIVAVNREVDAAFAGEICGTFVEVIVAPSFSPDAIETMRSKPNMRVLVLPERTEADEVRSIDGGVLVQRTPVPEEDWQVVSEREPTEEEVRAMRFAMKVCKHTKSNAIIYATGRAVVGIGAGQMNRVDSARIAVEKARSPVTGTVVASDAFLPFPDTMEVAAAAGATALVQPGGSIRDAEVIEAANRLNIAMVFTGVRYFRH
ncbi:bifunctional phosphoribosylaminoimidazolecarboxamide formyltransferase/IMP cyclohydrolase [Methanofollis fontis]|uniref:Bifunctional phosphoribosylaminoimidazolecarboxamide formyltransferase/inosine monophosphate cyclohydrolase n=1 Tax=Methanofollis fontis TaxID=2052832 RepID=A0A483CSV1_9EURY|nr:bifunctional phosphoribosylaminoimidazolecarboxamide formyltransferase/IMP cyclohydrolase [Methanofollis fontis]TAJ44281.1 bifunctional phosphoribosylaminoimidazolecarboxamide formyltransferase/inosine monophosphate cyclohydrolase [Methanofollis fontis]